MNERMRFVALVLDGEAMSDVCRSFGISRKTGYKIFNRYKEHDLEAFTDRSRRAVRFANQLPAQVEALIVTCKLDKPHWGARKIRELLLRRLASDVRVPAGSTIQAVLDRNGLVKRMNRPRQRATGTPNDLWCADFKGEFKLGNGRYCYPLTVTTTPRASCCCAGRWNQPARTSLLPPSSASASPSNASSPATRSKTAANGVNSRISVPFLCQDRAARSVTSNGRRAGKGKTRWDGNTKQAGSWNDHEHDDACVGNQREFWFHPNSHCLFD